MKKNKLTMFLMAGTAALALLLGTFRDAAAHGGNSSHTVHGPQTVIITSDNLARLGPTMPLELDVSTAGLAYEISTQKGRVDLARVVMKYSDGRRVSLADWYKTNRDASTTNPATATQFDITITTGASGEDSPIFEGMRKAPTDTIAGSDPNFCVKFCTPPYCKDGVCVQTCVSLGCQ